MSIIANLDINLRGNTSGIEKATDKTRKKLDETGAKVNKSLAAIESRFALMKGRLSALAGSLGRTLAVATGGLSLLTGALAGVASAAGVHTAIDELDNLGDTSKKIGIATEALAGLQHAAKLSGVESESLSAALVKMNRNLSQAAIGSGPAAGAIADLGLDAAALKSMAPDEAFQKIAEAINNIPNAADKAAVSMDIFGKAGANLLPMISEAGELGEKIKEAADIGLAASQREVEEVGAANDALDTMKNAFKGLFRTVAVAIAPFVKDFAEAITGGIKWLQTFRTQVVTVFRQIQFVFENFPEYVDLYFDKALLKIVEWYNDVENIFINVLPVTFQEGIKLIFPAWDALTDYIAYTMIRITNIIVDKAQKWANVIDKAVRFDFGGTANAIVEALDSTKERQEGEIEKMLRGDLERSTGKLGKLMDESAKKIGEAFNRGEGPIESAMRQGVESREKGLAARMQQFVDEKMGKVDIKKKSETESEFARAGKEQKTENKAIERGTQEALKIVSGNKEDKQIKKLEDIGKKQDKSNDLLAAILRKNGIAKANV